MRASIKQDEAEHYSSFRVHMGQSSLARCKARGLIVPVRKSKDYYTYDITDLALEVLSERAKQVAAAKEWPSQSSQSS